jgi:hypothetical protein
MHLLIFGHLFFGVLTFMILNASFSITLRYFSLIHLTIIVMALCIRCGDVIRRIHGGVSRHEEFVELYYDGLDVSDAHLYPITIVPDEYRYLFYLNLANGYGSPWFYLDR